MNFDEYQPTVFSTLVGSGGPFSPVDTNFTASGKVQPFCHNLRKDAKLAERQIKGGSKFGFYGKLGNPPSVDAVDGHHAKTSAVDGFSKKTHPNCTNIGVISKLIHC